MQASTASRTWHAATAIFCTARRGGRDHRAEEARPSPLCAPSASSSTRRASPATVRRARSSQAVASPDHRRQDHLLQLPQPARGAFQGDAQLRDDPAALHHVPSGEARPVRGDTCRSRRTASPAITRTGRTTTACSPSAECLPGLPRRLAAPGHDLRRKRRLEQRDAKHALIARGCINCHYFVHGSNAPAMRGKFFLR